MLAWLLAEGASIDVSQFGAWGVAMAILVWVIVDQRARLREQDAELKANREQMVADVIPTAIRMVDVLRDVAQQQAQERPR